MQCTGVQCIECPVMQCLEAKRHQTSKSGANMWCFVHFRFEMCFTPQRLALFQHPNLQKVARTCSVLYMLTWKCASHHNGVHFCDIATSKSGANIWCFVHFDLEMCFAHPPCHFLHRSRGVGVPIWHNFMGSVGLIWGRACHFGVICGFYMVL